MRLGRMRPAVRSVNFDRRHGRTAWALEKDPAVMARWRPSEHSRLHAAHHALLRNGRQHLFVGGVLHGEICKPVADRGTGAGRPARAHHRAQDAQLILGVLHEDLEHVVHAPHVLQQHAHVDALRCALQADATLDEFLEFHMAIAISVQHREDADSTLCVDPHRLEVRADLRVIQLIAELVPRDRAAIVAVCLGEEAPQLLHEALHLVQVVHDGHLLVQLRQLRGPLHEDARDNVQHPKDNEDDEGKEGQSVNPVDDDELVDDLDPVDAAGDPLEEN
mmetsp:Transcript_276/g.512  ORF Transcript_276/g.512 Transcript_276/m.512 type:complete len:277 (+) Transcript_276:40-870(+)